ncbi:MAG TPA: SMP-30/gluconolactonase/LRE family protein [Terriglobia bacterium]|nr:SMP-30/gluconolactonase/LRE family protein [Terriglobia bacterium]
MTLKASATRQCIFVVSALFVLTAMARAAQEEYPLGPDSQRQPGVPQGTVTHYTWTSPAGTGAYPGTSRDYWVYVPAQYTADKAACVMVFQDGASFIKEDGRARVPIVFDNLIAKHEMPVTIGIFVNPGVLKAPSPDQQDRFNRSFEYDGLGDRYARFALDEIIPEVAKHYNLSTKPDDRAIAGLSSGGICAFTVAWNRPDAFHRVLSFIGSFTDLRGGDIYPALIRKTEPKPLRVFLQDGSHDLNIYAGDWWMANQSMASALEYAGYDVKFVTGDKDHDMDQGGAILPDALRWLWRDYPQAIVKPAPNHSGDKRMAILDPGHEWELVSDESRIARPTTTQAAPGWMRTVVLLDFDPPFWGAAGIVADRHGDVLFSDDRDGSYVYKVGANGAPLVFKEEAQGARGLMFGTDDRLYVCETKSRRIVLYLPNASKKTLTEGVDCQDLAVNRDGGVYFTDPLGHRVWYLSPAGEKRTVSEDVHMPNGVRLSPDQSLLFVSDPKTRWVWSFQVRPEGSLAQGEPFYRLEANDESAVTGALGMTVDTLGYLYVATEMGIQVCDQPGRVVAIIDRPAPGALSGITFGGPDFQDLYAVLSGKLFKRHLLRKGTLPWIPQKPPVPQL